MRICAMTPDQRSNGLGHMANRWDALIVFYQKFCPSSSTIVASDHDRQFIVWLMEDRDIIVDSSDRVISEDSLAIVAKEHGLEKEELRRFYIIHHKMNLPSIQID